MNDFDKIKLLLEENNKKRDQNLDNKLHQLKVDLSESIDKRIDHLKPSKGTREQLNDFRENCAKISGQYGGEIKNLSIIMAENQALTKEMYDVFTKSGWSFKMMLKFFVSVGTITGGVIGLIELIKRMK